MDEKRTEYGYRVDGIDVWEESHDRDGDWIPARSDLGIPVIDLYDGTEAQAIARALDKAGVTGEILRRTVTVTRGPAEIVIPTP